jgi:hypothetical protein
MSYDSKIVKVQWFYGDLPPWKSEKAKGQGAIRGRDCIRPKKKRKFRENESRVSNGNRGVGERRGSWGSKGEQK